MSDASSGRGPVPGALIWVVVLLPLVVAILFSSALLVITAVQFATGATADSAAFGVAGLVGVEFFALLITDAALLSISHRDYRGVRAAGIAKPFPWGWTLLSNVVYVIGRSIVVFRATGRGLAPLWVEVGLVALNLAEFAGLSVLSALTR